MRNKKSECIRLFSFFSVWNKQKQVCIKSVAIDEDEYIRMAQLTNQKQVFHKIVY